MRQHTFTFSDAPEQREPESVAEDTSLPPPVLLRPDRQITYPNALTHYAWPDPTALHDRNTISIDRIYHTDDTSNTDHRFIIKRDDTVTVWFSDNKQETGTVTGGLPPVSCTALHERIAAGRLARKGFSG